MSLEAIKKFLKESGKDNPELSESHIDAAIESVKESEKGRYIAEAKKIRADIEKLKPYKQALEDVGFDGAVELPVFIESLKATKEKAKDGEGKTALEKEVSGLKATLKALSDENQKAKEREAVLQKERKTSLLKDRLIKDVGENLNGGEAHVKALIYENGVDLEDDGKTIVFVDGDLRIPYEDGVKKYLKAHEADLRDKQRGGAGSSGSNGRPVPSKDMPLSEMMKLR